MLSRFLYLLIPAVWAFRSTLSKSEQIAAPIARATGYWGYIRRGLLNQRTNPKAGPTWIAIMSLAMGSETPFLVRAEVVLAAFAVSALGHLAEAVAFSTAPADTFYRLMPRWIDGALG